ncbi:MAG TPA: NUDIX domain-containing protein [Mycobacteriales bacterium]|nr:NUDIX domain-containing protein [Mycobacteriales bacterium]
MSNPVHRTRIAAYGVAISAGNVLLTRASERSDVPGTWWLPGGGIDFGEQPSEAVVREFAEEAGVQTRIVRLLDVVSTVADRPPPFADERVHTLRVIFEVEVIGGELRPESDGSSDRVAWVPLEQTDVLPVMSFFKPFLSRS